MLRLTVKCRLPNVLFSKATPSVSARRLSSLGNPMFPHRPLPELETFEQSIENSKKAKKESGGNGSDKKEFIDILADHGGKIALVVFAGIIGLFYTYYASGKERNKLEDGISDAALIEPYEIQELRFTNKLSKDDYISIVEQCKAHFPIGQATYVEFVHFLRDNVVLPAASEANQEPVHSSSAAYGAYGANAVTPSKPAALRKLHLKSTHLLDRLVMGLVQNKMGSSSPSPTLTSGNDSTCDSNKAFTDQLRPSPSVVSWTRTPLDVDLLLVVLNLAMEPDAEARIQALYALAAQYPVDPSTSVQATGNLERSEDGNGEQAEVQAQLSQDSISRGTAERVIRHLIETDQVPPAKQTMESGVKYPIKLHRRKNEADMVADYEVKRKLNKKIESCDYDSFRSILLSNQVCAWGECYTNNDR